MGYDSDHPRAEGEVGKCGVAISSLADMEDLFHGIPLDQVSTSMTINGPAAMLFCFYVAAAEKQGVASTALRGTVQNDILKEYMAQHAWVYPVEPALKIIVDMFEWCAAHRDDAVPLPDRRSYAHRAAADEQRGPGGLPGARRGARGHAVAPHQLIGRNARAPHGRGGPPGAPDPADHRARDRRGGRDRPVRRLLLRGVAHRPAGARGGRPVRGNPVSGWRGQGNRKRLVPAADRALRRAVPARCRGGRSRPGRRERLPGRPRPPRRESPGLRWSRGGPTTPAPATPRPAPPPPP